jgi:hypothetical protein
MLFLYRPRQTWMPYRPPRHQTEQAAYNRELQQQYGATRRVPRPLPDTGPAPPAPAGEDIGARLRELAQLHADGALSDDEFAAAKAKVLASGTSSR